MTAHIDTSAIELKYGSYRFQPAPLLTYSQTSVTNDAGDRIADQVTLSFNGTLLNLDALESGDLSQMITRRDLVINALSGDGEELQILHGNNSTQPSGTPIVSGVFPRITDLSFDEGVWVNRIDYSFSAEYETNAADGTAPVDTTTDEWSFEEDNSNKVIRVTRTVNAQGINTSASGNASNAFEHAKTWVVARLGVTNKPSGMPGIVAIPSSGFHIQEYRTEAGSEIGGNFSVNEQSVITSGRYADSYTAQFQQDALGITTVTLNGNVEGFGRYEEAADWASSGWNNVVQALLPERASGEYELLGGSQSLNTSAPRSLSVTRSAFEGNITYSTSYSDEFDNLPSGIAELEISKQVNFPIRLHATFPIPQRAQGNIVQDIGTTTEGQITINGAVVGLPTTQLAYVKNVAADKANEVTPNVALYNTLRYTAFNTTENEDDLNAPNPSGTVSFT
jgi:hypothetical protein